MFPVYEKSCDPLVNTLQIKTIFIIVNITEDVSMSNLFCWTYEYNKNKLMEEGKDHNYITIIKTKQIRPSRSPP